MTKFRLTAWCGIVAVVLNSSVVFAQTEFKNALTEKYGFKTVSCYTCHSKKTEVTEEEWDKATEAGSTKKLRNSFGKEFDKHLKDKNVTGRLAEVKGLDPDDEKRIAVEQAVQKDFLEALKVIEAMKAPSGGTYAEALEKGEIEGVTLRD